MPEPDHNRVEDVGGVELPERRADQWLPMM